MPNLSNDDDLGDLGLSLLANKKQRPDSEDGPTENVSSTPSSSEKSSTSMFGSFFGGNNNESSSSELQSESSINNMKDIDLDKELNEMNLNNDKGMSGPGLPNFESNNTFTPPSTESNPYSTIPKTEGMSYEDIQKAKFDLLCKFERLRDRGVRVPKNFSMSSDYEEMQYEYDRLVHQRKMSNSVKM